MKIPEFVSEALPLEKVVSDIAEKFIGTKNVEGVTFEVSKLGKATILTFKDSNTEHNISNFIREMDVDTLKILLNSQGLELGREQTSGNHNVTFLILEKKIDGKINWRRWVNYPETLSEKSAALLDEVSGVVEMDSYIEKFKGDGLSKFSNFIHTAFALGLITQQEHSEIEDQYSSIANGPRG